jgi:peptidoglycan/xylan/chitin deacetylase (PgdA/CDA1 family)
VKLPSGHPFGNLRYHFSDRLQTPELMELERDCYNLASMIRDGQARGERERLARVLLRSGISSLLSLLPAKDSLLVLTYHRVGDDESDPWDPAIFSATADEFEAQVSYVKRNHALVTLEEAFAFVDGTDKSKSSQCRVLFTFDDGYLDNYEIAYPILKSHGAQGVFFLCSNIVGSGHVPWWDHIAYLVKNGTKKKFSLTFPKTLDVDIDKDGLGNSLRNILELYKTPENLDLDRFINELKIAVKSKDLPADSRRFLTWDEAGEMQKGGMAIGAHTHTHPMLSKLSEDEQRRELAQSRAIISEKLGIKVDAFAYPFGSPNAFTKTTERIAQEVGFRGAFSYYGNMTNQKPNIDRFNLKRVTVGSQSWARMKVQAEICRVSGTFWP